jgi:hypothetical protein
MSEVTIDDGPVSTPWGGLGAMIAFLLIVGGLTIAWQSGQALTLRCEGTSCTAQRTWLGVLPLGPAEPITKVTGASTHAECRGGNCFTYLVVEAAPRYEATVNTLEGGRYAARALNSYLDDSAAGPLRVSTVERSFVAQRYGLLVLPLLVAGGAAFAYSVRDTHAT